MSSRHGSTDPQDLASINLKECTSGVLSVCVGSTAAFLVKAARDQRRFAQCGVDPNCLFAILCNLCIPWACEGVVRCEGVM